MSADRLETLRTWQDLALRERDTLIALREQLAEGDENYPRLRELDSIIGDVDASIAHMATSAAKAANAPQPRGDNTHLQVLLSRQERAFEERDELDEARKAVWAEAELLGQTDLDDEQDRRYRALTREIADVDAEIDARAEEIEVLAALGAVS